MQTDLRFRFAVFALGGGIAALLAGACSRERDGFENIGRIEDDAGVDARVCGFRCSRDLKTVMKDCNDGAPEEAVATCGPDEGCGIGKCVDACQAAELSKGSVGCSFWTLPPDDGHFGLGACFAAMVANTWDRPVSLSAELGNEPLDISQSVYIATRRGNEPEYTKLEGPVPPGQVALVFLSQAPVPVDPDASRCPPGVVPAVKADPVRHGTVKTRAFHIKSDAPVAAYSIFPYGGADSAYPTATLLLPVSSWDKSYIAVSTGKFGTAQPSDADRRTIQIIANEDDTKVSMRPVEAVGQGDGVDPAAAGEATSWTLSRGQVLQITQDSSLTGSPISATKPIGMFGGSPCTFIPNQQPFCDLTQQQIAPFSQWGTQYALVPFKPRTLNVTKVTRENVPWSIVGAVDGTVLTYDPERPTGAPATLSAGQVVNFVTEALVNVRSQDSKHPFYVGVHMTGATNGGGSPHGGMTSGDPDFVNVVPSEQFLDRYVFFTDFTFPDTTLTVVRRKTANGFRPVHLACAGEISDFIPLGASGEYEYAYVELTKGFAPRKFAKGECGYGRHEAQSEGPFSITVWGVGTDTSYGYAGGMGSRPINDAPPPIVE
jgi:IgGFc binding protein